MIHAYIKTEPHGYVVWARTSDNKDDLEHYPLRNFGDYQSAAIEFRDYINRAKGNALEKLEQNVKKWAQSYNPENLYSYCRTLQNGNIVLIRQHNHD